MANVTVPIPAIFPVRKPLRIIFQDPNNTPSMLEDPMELEAVLEIYQGLDWVKTAEFINPFSKTSDTATVLIDKALAGTMNQTPFDVFSTGLKPLEKIIKTYRLKTRTILDGVPIDPYDITEEKTAWLAGNSYADARPDVSGMAFKILSTRPLTRKYHPEEKLFACFLPLVSGAAVNLSITYTPQQGTPETVNLALGPITAFVPFAYVWEVPSQIGPTAQMAVTLTGLTGTTETINLLPLLNTGNNFMQMVYANSLGGFDTLAMTGQAQKGFESLSEQMEGQLFDPTTGQEGNFIEFNTATRAKYLLRSGYLTLKDVLAARDLFTIKKNYLLINGQLQKVITENGYFLTEIDDSGIHFLEIEASTAFSDFSISRS